MTSTVGIISCGSTKKDHPCEASSMYDEGILFQKMKALMEATYDSYYILSGKYGLLAPNEIIEPYEDVVFFAQKVFRDRAKQQGKVIKALPASEQRQWAQKVAKQIEALGAKEIHFHINIYYWKPLEKELRNVEGSFTHHKFKRSLGANLKELNQLLISGR